MSLNSISSRTSAPISSSPNVSQAQASRTSRSSGNLGTRVVKNFTSLMGNHFKLMHKGLKESINVGKGLYSMAKIAVKKDTDDFWDSL